MGNLLTSSFRTLGSKLLIMVGIMVFAFPMTLLTRAAFTAKEVHPKSAPYVKEIPVYATDFEERKAVYGEFLASLSPETVPIPNLKRSIFDGEWIALDAREEPVAVMIDNYSLARPQHSGITEASVVYEALAEGGITRLMAVYPRQNLNRVGPTRSARHYFVDFAAEYRPVYVHAGGSPQAHHFLWMYRDLLQHLDEDEVPGNGAYTFRDLSFAAPHNLFVNLDEVRMEAERREYAFPAAEAHFCFEEEPERGVPVSAIGLDFPGWGQSNYYAHFAYDAASRTYKRGYRRGGEAPHIDHLGGEQVAPTNVVVQVAPYFLLPDDPKERIDMITRGSERAFYFSRGTMREGRWEKLADHETAGVARTVFRDSSGAELCLAPGQTWVAVIGRSDLLEMNP